MRLNNTRSQIVKKIQKSIMNLSVRGKLTKSIVVFGCTMWIKDVEEALATNGHSIRFIIDNNPDKIGGKCLSYDVITPVEVKKLKNKIQIVICSDYWMEMESQLREYGLEKNKDFFTVDITLSEGWFVELRRLNHIRKGYLKYRQYYDMLSGDKTMVFVCPWAASGDIFMSGLFLSSYVEYNGIEDYCVLVLGQMAKKVAMLFEWKNVFCITENDKTDMLDAWMLLGSEIMRIKILLYWGWRVKRFPQSDNPMKLTFLDVMKHDVFELPTSVSPVFPKNLPSDYAPKLFESMNLKKGKTVIIAPYAGSYRSSIPNLYWEELVEFLNMNGFTVCTNSSGDSEPIIKGTQGIFFPFTEAINTVEYAGYFIALRSGLCDIVSYSKCKKIILYESMLNAVNMNYFSLRRMGLSEDAVEYEYNSDSLDNLFENIRREIV